MPLLCCLGSTVIREKEGDRNQRVGAVQRLWFCKEVEWVLLGLCVKNAGV